MRLSLLTFLLISSFSLSAQKYFGIRFASDYNWFPLSDQVGLVDNGFTTGKLGLYYASYKQASGFEIGLNVNYKDGNGQGFSNLPVVMRDWGPDQNVGYMGVEMDVKAGPRIWPIYPKIGYILGYRFTRLGFFSDPDSEFEVNPLYLHLPFGVSANLPTQWGLVGFGAFFNVGVLNVANLQDQPSFRNGGRHRSFTFEINVAIQSSDE
ncbi:MAG: hypothetical protein AAFY71_00135 [Bacteroidota bacterium]